jgi:hypothetical protein
MTLPSDRNSPTVAAVSVEYHDPIAFALIQQIPIALLGLLILDDGTIARFCAVPMIGYWLAALWIWTHRPHSPTRSDLLFLKWSFFPLLTATAFFAMMWQSLRAA